MLGGLVALITHIYLTRLGDLFFLSLFRTVYAIVLFVIMKFSYVTREIQGDFCFFDLILDSMTYLWNLKTYDDMKIGKKQVQYRTGMLKSRRKNPIENFTRCGLILESFSLGFKSPKKGVKNYLEHYPSKE